MIRRVVYDGETFNEYSWDYHKKAIIGRNGRYLKPNRLKYGSIVNIKKNGIIYTVILEKLEEQMDELQKKMTENFF
jgi:hypothetical protein